MPVSLDALEHHLERDGVPVAPPPRASAWFSPAVPRVEAPHVDLLVFGPKPCILERAREQFPGAQPRIISDNGPQFISRDFKAYIRLTGMTHVRTSPYYPQSNGKLERLNKTVKVEAIRVRNPGSLDEGPQGRRGVRAPLQLRAPP
ncbi:MAG: transposase family protein [Deltaproteobacteria bacterium]|nr:transposase family protein [Deltaproteobacteria bacterium]